MCVPRKKQECGTHMETNNDVVTIEVEKLKQLMLAVEDLINNTTTKQVENHEDDSVWWTMRDLERVTKFKRCWIETNILYDIEYKKILDVKKNKNGFVMYPQGKGSRWAFNAKLMREFLDENSRDIFVKSQKKKKVG